jgi:hypothetical protein
MNFKKNGLGIGGSGPCYCESEQGQMEVCQKISLSMFSGTLLLRL